MTEEELEITGPRCLVDQRNETGQREDQIEDGSRAGPGGSRAHCRHGPGLLPGLRTLATRARAAGHQQPVVVGVVVPVFVMVKVPHESLVWLLAGTAWTV